MIGFTLYGSARKTRQNGAETRFPNARIVTDLESLKAALDRQYSPVCFGEGTRSDENYTLSDVVVLDIDNEKTDAPESWTTPEKLAERLPGVCFYTETSRNHMKKKGRKSARPRFHALFPVGFPVRDLENYRAIKAGIVALCPDIFDPGDYHAATQMKFVAKDPEVKAFEGECVLSFPEFDMIPQDNKKEAAEREFERLSQSAIAQIEREGVQEGARHSQLISYATSVFIRGGKNALDESEARIRETNAEKFFPPLDGRELEDIIRDARKYAEKRFSQPGYKEPGDFFEPANPERKDGRKVFRHDKMGEWLIQEMHIKHIENHLNPDPDGLELWSYDEKTGVYVPGLARVEKHIRTIFPELKNAQILEVLKYISGVSYDEVELCGDSRYLAFKNTVLDTETGGRAEKSPDLNLVSLIPWRYHEPDPATLELVKKIFDAWSEGDKEISALLLAVMGNCLESKIRPWNRAVILYGRKACGKSAFIFLLQAMLGAKNYSLLELKDFKERFSAIHLKNKKANIKSDISPEGLTDAALLKQSVTGDQISGEHKGKDKVFFYPYATHVWSCNALPYIRDDQGGVERRLLIVPFDHDFLSEPVEIVPGEALEDTIKRQDIIEAALWLAVQAMIQTRNEQGYKIPQKCADILAEYAGMSNSAVAWCNHLREEYGVRTVDEFLDHWYGAQATWPQIRDEYTHFCYENDFARQIYDAKRLIQELSAVYSCPLAHNKLKKINGKAIRTIVKAR